MRLHPSRVILPYLFLLSLLILPSRAAASTIQEAGSLPAKTGHPVLPDAPPPTLAEEIGILIELEMEQLENLQIAIEHASSIGQVLKLQRQMQQLKLGTELNMLRAQLRHLDVPADQPQAEALQAAIESLLEVISLDGGTHLTDPILDGRN